MGTACQRGNPVLLVNMAFPVVATSANAAGNGSVTITKPASLAVGDMMLAWVSCGSYSNGNARGGAPDGTWNILYEDSGGGVFAFGSYWKIATSTDVAASNFTFCSGSSDRCAGGILRITGTDPTPILTSNHGLASSSASALSAGITPSKQCLFVMLVGSTKNGSYTLSVSGQAVVNNNPSWTSVFTVSGNDTGNHAGVNASWANETGAPNSATGNATATISTSVNENNLQIIAIQSTTTFVATSLPITIHLNQPMFIRKMVVAALHVLGTLGVPTITLAALWKNQSKNSSSWTNQNKS